MTSLIVPAIICLTLLHGVAKGVNVFEAMGEGIKDGLKTCLGIFPAVLIMVTVISMLKASGAVTIASQLLQPVLSFLGIPAECLPLMLLRPFSGSGALSAGSEIIMSGGADSLTGRIAAVMLGSSETSIYTIGVYSAYIGMKNSGNTLKAALTADLTAFIAAGIAVRLLF